MIIDDRRLAALAAALHVLSPHPGRPYPFADCGWRERHRADAAAILAALPSDWCGHDETQAFANGEQWGYQEKHQDAEAEITRLRAALGVHHRGLTMVDDGPEKCALCALAPEAQR